MRSFLVFSDPLLSSALLNLVFVLLTLAALFVLYRLSNSWNVLINVDNIRA